MTSRPVGQEGHCFFSYSSINSRKALSVLPNWTPLWENGVGLGLAEKTFSAAALPLTVLTLIRFQVNVCSA